MGQKEILSIDIHLCQATLSHAGEGHSAYNHPTSRPFANSHLETLRKNDPERIYRDVCLDQCAPRGEHTGGPCDRGVPFAEIHTHDRRGGRYTLDFHIIEAETIEGVCTLIDDYIARKKNENRNST
jgi:hypothetical protein